MTEQARGRCCTCCKTAPPNGQTFGWCKRHAKPITLCPHCLAHGHCGCGQGRAVDGSETPTQVMAPAPPGPKLDPQDVSPATKAMMMCAITPDTISFPADLLGVAAGHWPDGRPWVGLHVMTEHGPRLIQFSCRHAMAAARELVTQVGMLQARDQVN